MSVVRRYEDTVFTNQFVTLSGIDYSPIASVYLDRLVVDLAIDPSDRKMATIEVTLSLVLSC
jgi:hypothetical protein